MKQNALCALLFCFAVVSVFPQSAIPPDWVHNLPPDTETKSYFWGFSAKRPTVREAMNDAEKDAKLRIAGFIGELITGSYTEKSVYKSDKEYVLEDAEQIDETLSSFTSQVMSGIKTVDRFIKQSENDGETHIEIQILAEIDRAAILAESENFRESIAKNYAGLLVEQATPVETIRLYKRIVAMLEENPLHRAVAWYDTENGRVSLYDYLTMLIRASPIKINVRIEFARKNTTRRPFFDDYEEKIHGIITTLLTENGYAVSLNDGACVVTGIFLCSERDAGTFISVDNPAIRFSVRSGENETVFYRVDSLRNEYKLPGKSWASVYQRIWPGIKKDLEENFIGQFKLTGYG